MITMSCRIDGGDFDSAGLATRKLKEQLARIGVGAPAMRRAMIASYEAEMNVVIHARTGTLWIRLDDEKLDLEIADEGPGIPDVALALREGWSTASAKARAATSISSSPSVRTSHNSMLSAMRATSGGMAARRRAGRMTSVKTRSGFAPSTRSGPYSTV